MTYKLMIPTHIVNGQAAGAYSVNSFNNLEDLKEFLLGYRREYRKLSKVYRVVEEEIDITKEEW